MIKYARGTIWWAYLEGSVDEPGHGVKKTRPVIIVSRNDFNASHPTVTAVPLTQKAPINPKIRPAVKTSMPFEEDAFSYAMCDQIRLIDKAILDNYYGQLDAWEMTNVELALSYYLSSEKVDGEIADTTMGSQFAEE